MTDIETDPPKLTIKDIALMRQIIAWRKTVFVELRSTHGVWMKVGDPDDRRAVTWDEGEVGLTSHYDRERMRWVGVTSLGQAVDVLVAFGYLPARFSTAYRDGWSAGYRVCDGFWDPEGRSLTQEQIGDVYPAVSW